MAEKPVSFFGSVTSGILGAVKGGIVGALLGLAVGAALGGIVALLMPAATAISIGITTGEIIGLGAGYGALLLGATGMSAGTLTGVAQKQQQTSLPAIQAANIAETAMSQGVELGHNMELQEHEQELGSKWQDKVKSDQIRTAMAQTQSIH